MLSELNTIREALWARVQVIGLRRTAAEAWIRVSSLTGLLEGASPRGKTLGYLRTWHRTLSACTPELSMAVNADPENPVP